MMIPAVPFLFIRHGQTDWNVEGRMQGKTDIPLNAKGVQQARDAAAVLQCVSFDAVVSSDLKRALQTAEMISEVCGKPLFVDEGLQERSFGTFEGQLTADMKVKYGLNPEDSISKILPPDAEQWHETKARSVQTVEARLTRHAPQTVLFVSHGAFFRALYESLGGPRMEAANATPYLFTPVGAGWALDTLAKNPVVG